MSCFNGSLRRAGVAWATLLLAGSPAWAQSPGDPFPYSNFSFGSNDRPYRGRVSSDYGGALRSGQESGASLRPLTGPLSSSQRGVPDYSLRGRNAYTGLTDDTYAPRPDDRARIWLRLPGDAEVWFEGVKTKQTGTLRYYFSPPLAADRKYSYQIQARWSKDGEPVEWKKRIEVRAGDAIRLDLDMASAERNSATPETENPTRRQAGK